MAQQSTSGLGVAHPVQYSPPKEQPKNKTEEKKEDQAQLETPSY